MGWRCPDSYALITLCVTLARAARSAWDRPACLRAWRSKPRGGRFHALPYSSGAVEGHVNHKMIKRQMYGRAKADLSRKRILLAD